MSSIIDKIIHDSEEKYLNLSEPNYAFVSSSLEKGVYNQLLKTLIKNGFDITEDTDINDMVCRYIYIKTKNHLYSLYLSLVGEYALLLKKTKNNYDALTFNSNNLEETEIRILDILEDNGLIVLDRKIIDIEIKSFINSYIVDYDHPTVYNILFIEEYPPWHY